MTKLALLASLALAARAVLIPPSVALATLDDNADTLAITPFKRTVAVECPGCAVASLDGDTLTWGAETGNTFLLDFDVGDREDSLEIDGVQLYPPTFASAATPFYVTQLSPSAAPALRLRVTGYTFHFSSAETVSEAGMELLPMTFHITSIESAPVAPPAVTVNLLKDPAGRLMIASFDAADASCGASRMCKWRGAVADRIAKLRTGCHKRPHPHHSMHPGSHGHGHGDGHSHSHGLGHGHAAHHHRMHMFLRRAFFTILVPILIGIFAGTLTYLVGMALGCLIAVVVARVRGPAYQAVALDDSDLDGRVADHVRVDVKGEKCEGLPPYEAPPVYCDEAGEHV